MQAWLCENPTGVEALQWKELPTPEPKAGEVRIAIRAASLNFPDLLIVQDKYQMKPPLPFVPGSEYAGTVDAVGAGVERLKIGDEKNHFQQQVQVVTGSCRNFDHDLVAAPVFSKQALIGQFPFHAFHVDAGLVDFVDGDNHGYFSSPCM